MPPNSMGTLHGTFGSFSLKAEERASLSLGGTLLIKGGSPFKGWFDDKACAHAHTHTSSPAPCEKTHDRVSI